jgi:predicted Fe-S protein YdhL (DUF1289 family)
MAEISGWLSMDPSQRRAVLDLLAERATRLRAACPVKFKVGERL